MVKLGTLQISAKSSHFEERCINTELFINA